MPVAIIGAVPATRESRCSTRSLGRWLAIALGALALGIAAAPPARAAAPAGFVGMVSPDTMSGNSRYQATQLAAMHRSGVTLLRAVFDWASIERKRNVYNFSAYNNAVAAAARQGIQLMPILFNEPSYLSARPRRHAKKGTYRPKSLNSIGAFAQAAVRYYGPNGTFWRAHPTLPQMPVRIWQIWDEPNLPVYWRPKPRASQYVAMLGAASRAIHALDPGAEVVSAGIPQSKIRGAIELFRYLRSMLQSGAGQWANTLGVNAYSRTPSGMIALLRHVRATLNAAHATGVAIRVTEFGWSDVGPKSAFRLGRTGQARAIRAVITDFGIDRAALELRGFVYFGWRDAHVYPGGHPFWGLHTGLLKLNAKAKIALRYFRSAANALGP